MKRNILIVLMIVTAFLTGKNNIYAEEQNCSAEVYTNKCQYVNYDDYEELYLYYNATKTWIVVKNSYPGGKTSESFYYNINNEDEENVYYITGDYQQKEVNCKKISETSNIRYNKIGISQLTNGCPQKIYTRYWSGYNGIRQVYFKEWTTGFYDDPEILNTPNSEYGEKFNRYELYKDGNATLPPTGEDPIIIDDCKQLLSDNLIDMINSVMNIVRIGVPILLIGLLTYDFATAVFAGSDDKMNKAKSKAIKRIIIAVVIFFVPTLINFVFNIVNEVWGKNYGTTCEITNNDN